MASKMPHWSKPIWFVNHGVNEYHLNMNVKLFTKLKEAKEYLENLDFTQYSNQCWQVVKQHGSSGKFSTPDKENEVVMKSW
jgi:hypothetical protein